MTTPETRVGRNTVAVTSTVPEQTSGESGADRVLTFAAMAGAVGGAVGGAALGAAAGTAFPIAWGTLGTMLGSGSAAAGWCLLVRLWAGLFSGSTERQHPANRVAVVPDAS
jgi:hypothetical protein